MTITPSSRVRARVFVWWACVCVVVVGGWGWAGTATEQLDRDEEADLDPATGDHRDPAGQVGRHLPFLVVKCGAGRAELVVVMVHLLVCGRVSGLEGFGRSVQGTSAVGCKGDTRPPGQQGQHEQQGQQGDCGAWRGGK